MPLTPQQYLEWWLTSSIDALKELMDRETLELAPQHAGFDTHVARRLRNFDNDVQLREALRQHVNQKSLLQVFDLSSNPRNKLRELTLTVFKKLEDGGVDLKGVMQGLAELNMVELRRRRLVAETPLTFKPNHAAFGSAAMIQELNKKATEKFGQFYVGFRASTILEEFAQQRTTRKPSVELMAVVNALFPAHDLLKNSEDVSLVPYTDAHLSCIRFSLFCHLMGENPSSEKQQLMIQQKVFLWASLPKYQQAYKAFTQYIEEFKTIETLCFNVLQLAENASSRRRSGSNRSSFTPNSVVMVKSILKGSPQSPHEVEDQVVPKRPVSPEFVASAPPVPNPLLKGLPGREVSPSKTDGAAFAFDDPSAPKLRVEHSSTLSKTYEADGETVVKGEKVGVKFLDPGKKLKRKKTRLSAKKVRKVLKKNAKKDDIPPVPPTPDIPESMKSTITRSGLKFLQRMRSQPDIQSRGSNGSKYAQLAAVFANSNKAKSTTKLVKQPVRSASSQDQARDSFYHRTSSLPGSNIRSSQYSQYSQPNLHTQLAENTATMGQHAGAIAQGEGSSPRTPLPKPDVKYDICEPRLSTMEYTRLYLLEEANAKKEKRLCELPPPKKVWLWGPRWEEFLVLPKIPSTIKRRFSLEFDDEQKQSMAFTAFTPLDGNYDSDADSIETIKGIGSVSAKPPRLSLNLETMASTLSSLMNLASLGSDDAAQAPSQAQSAEVAEVVCPESPILGSTAFANVKKNCALPESKDDVTLPPPSIVSAASTNKDEEDLYSDDRHLWPSPMSKRSIRLVSSSPVAEETTVIIRDDSQSIENTTRQLSDDAFETSSIYSNDSAKTAVFVGNNSKGTDSTPRTPVTARLREPLATPDEASPTRPGLPFSYSCASFNSVSSDRSPLTHFPISAEQRSRATTEDMVQGVITQSGGRLRYEETRQVQVVEGKLDAEIKASSADIWHTDDYMEPALQPAPLNLSKKPSVTKSRNAESEILTGSMPSNDILAPIRPFIYTPKSGRFAKYANDDYYERPTKPYESGFVPLPGSLLYEADKNAEFSRTPNSSKAKSTISGVITPSRPSPARESVQSQKVAYEPRASRSMNELHTTPGAASTYEALSELDEFFGVGPYEKAFLEKYPEAAKPFVLPPKVEESPASPVFTSPTYAAPPLRRRDLSIQQHRALPLNTVERVLERKPRTSTNVSSFALHRAQGNKATILPTLAGRSRANAANTRGLEIDIGQDQEYEDSISGEFPPQHALLDNGRRFSFQRYDISTRRPSSQARPSTFLEPPSPVSPCENVVAAAEAKKITNAPTSTLGNLFRRRNRNRNVRQPQALQTQQGPAAPIATPPANSLSSPTPVRTAKAAASTLTKGNRPSWKD
ncbi:hypothetical protein MKX08_006859 [Trichoderma sp. CBMAI-0020]|nr:hypothetical protein MKX08_006859 [Trichoderma sp. CBMAI-0020]